MTQQHSATIDKTLATEVQADFGNMVAAPKHADGKGNGHDNHPRIGCQTPAEGLNGQDRDQSAQEKEGLPGAPGERDDGVAGDSLLDLMSRPKPFDAGSFAAADAAQGLAGDGVPFTVIENCDGQWLTKSFSASADGRTIEAWEAARNSSLARAICAGLDADRAHTFASLRTKVGLLRSNQCLVTAPLPGTAPTRQVIFKDKWERLPTGERDLAGDGPIYRGSECFAYPPGKPGLLELDLDVKDWPAEIRKKQHEAGGLFRALLQADPQLATAGYYIRPSSSSGIRDVRTGFMRPVGAKHIFFIAEDAADIPRYCETLFKRLVLAGFGFPSIFKDGKTEVRSLLDPVASGRPERLWYDATPVLFDNGHGQHLELVAKYRQEQVREGPWLDTRRLADLNAIEQADYDRIVAELEAAAKPEADRVREAYIDARVERGVAAGLPADEARRLAFDAVDGGRLDVGGAYRFDDSLWRSGWEILEDVAAIDGKSGADPLEADYGGGHNKAIWYQKPGEPGVFCYSHAHGKRVFLIVYDVADWIALFDRVKGTLPQRLEQLRDAGQHYCPEDRDQAHEVLRRVGMPSPTVLDFVDPEEMSRDALLKMLCDQDRDRLALLKCLGPLLRAALADLRDEDEVIGLGVRVDWGWVGEVLDAINPVLNKDRDSAEDDELHTIRSRRRYRLRRRIPSRRCQDCSARL